MLDTGGSRHVNEADCTLGVSAERRLGVSVVLRSGGRGGGREPAPVVP